MSWVVVFRPETGPSDEEIIGPFFSKVEADEFRTIFFAENATVSVERQKGRATWSPEETATYLENRT